MWFITLLDKCPKYDNLSAKSTLCAVAHIASYKEYAVYKILNVKFEKKTVKRLPPIPRPLNLAKS